MVVLYTGWMVDRVSDEWLYCTLVRWWIESWMSGCTVLVGWWIESGMNGCTVHWLDGG